MKKKLTLGRVIKLAFNTTIAYFVFFVSLASVPYAQALWAQTKTTAKNIQGFNYVVVGESKLPVEIVDSEAERTKGLSGRKSLKPGNGMLFVFDETDYHGIWMKDMKFAIDIVWLSDNMQVVHIEEDVTPETYPEVFTPRKPARYVLEIPAGFVSQEGIKLGDLTVIF